LLNWFISSVDPASDILPQAKHMFRSIAQLEINQPAKTYGALLLTVF